MIETDVLIVGSGPAGASSALFLSKLGVENIVVTRERWSTDTPRAHITNVRTMEILRNTDPVLEERCIRLASPQELMANNVWVTSLAGEEIARIHAWGNHPARLADYILSSPSRMCDLPQNLLEPALLSEAARLGSHVRFDTEFINLAQDESGVTADVLDRLTGQTLQFRAKYLIGADGGRSRIVEQLGLPLIGKAGLGMAINIQFRGDLSRFVAHRPGVLYWVMQPGLDQWAGGGTLRMVRPWDEWLAIVGHDPSTGEPDLAPERLRRIVLGLIGDEAVDITVRGASKWMINHIVAESYSSGRVFCMGDAVHRHPPTNGLGSNTSIQDAFNLAWKLKFVLAGQAGPGLLESYSEERQPVGRQVVDRAIKSLMEYQPITEAIGVRPGQTPEQRQGAIEARKSTGASGTAQRQAILKGAALKSYEYNALGVELNQVYRSRAIAKMDVVDAEPTSDAELHYHPSTRPGARLPHAWLHKGSQRASTHDLVGRGRFTILVGPEGHHWAAAAIRVSGALGIEVSCFSIGPGCDYEDTYGDWTSLREVDDTGCIVVRPDMHVVWRETFDILNAEENLRYGIANALCRQDSATVAE